MIPSLLFRPGCIGPLTIRNRIVMAPMATNLASAVGDVTDPMVAYYAARARGGAGLVIVENATIDHTRGGNGAVQLRLDEDRHVPGLYRLSDAIHAGGAVAAIQVNHAGAVARSGEPVGPSDVSWTPDRTSPKPLNHAAIDRLIEGYAQAACRAKRAGFDAVEIHGAHGYLIAQFLSPHMNRRTDAYGGTPVKRWRFATDVVRAVREAVGERFPVLFRLSGDEYLPNGRGIQETCVLAGSLVDAGVDAIHVTAATAANPQFQLEPMSFPEAWRIDLAAAVKSNVDVPVIGVGVIRRPETAERVLAEGKADFVAVGRGLIADPEWANKAQRDGPGILRCISCNRCVLHRVYEDRPIRCSVNPRAGRESDPARKPVGGRRVLVVGGGPAGLSCASRAARRGHKVTLAETSSELGGRLHVAGLPPHKEKIDWLIEDLIHSIPDDVDIHLGRPVDSAWVEKIAPDVVILATGAKPRRLGLPGGELSHVRSADDVLRSGPPGSGEIVVIGGGMVGCETALFCAGAGGRVTILELLASLCEDCEPITRGEILRRLGEQDVRIRMQADLKQITPTGVEAVVAEKSEFFPAELVVCAIGSTPESKLADALSTSATPILRIGDAQAPRGIFEAVHEGWRAADMVDEVHVQRKGT